MKRNPIRFRAFLVMLFVVIFVGLFVIKLVDIQVIRASAYNEESVGKRSIPSTVLAKRGTITDAKGTVMAESVLRYNITVSPKNAKDFLRQTDRSEVTITPQQAAIEIGTITGQKPEEILKIIADALAQNPKSDFAYIKKAVDVDTFRALYALEIPWLFFEQAPGRTYPAGAVGGNLLGYVGQDGQPQAGLELAQNDCLAGTNGEEVYQRGADGIRIPGSTVTSVAAENGGSLKLTINSDLQWYSQQVLAKRVTETNAQWGIVIVQEVKTGKLLTVADYPTVDPNNVNGSDESARGSRAFTSPYEPGSTIKALTAAGLINSGAADPSTQVIAPYALTFPNGAKVNDAVPHGSWPLTLTGVLQESSNTGITQLGQALDAKTRYDYLRAFGFGETSAVNFPGESGGILHPYEEWDNQTTYNTMFGQGLATTAVQVAGAYQTLGNGGVHLPASLVEECVKADGTVVKPEQTKGTQVVSPEAARTTVDMLENVVTQGALTSVVQIPGYRSALKTGTAQQSDGSGKYGDKYIVSNAGLIPADDPQYVVYVVIAYPDGNTFMASPPVFRDVMAQVIKEYRIQPSTSASPALAVRF